MILPFGGMDPYGLTFTQRPILTAIDFFCEIIMLFFFSLFNADHYVSLPFAISLLMHMPIPCLPILSLHAPMLLSDSTPKILTETVLDTIFRTCGLCYGVDEADSVPYLCMAFAGNGVGRGRIKGAGPLVLAFALSVRFPARMAGPPSVLPLATLTCTPNVRASLTGWDRANPQF